MSSHQPKVTRNGATPAWSGPVRFSFLLLGVCAVGLLILVLRGESPGVAQPASPEFPALGGSHDDSVRPEGTSLSLAIAALEGRVSALEEKVRFQLERQVEASAEQGSSILTSEEFEQRYGGAIRAMLAKMKLEEARLAEVKRIRDEVRRYTEVYRLDVAQAEALFPLLVKIRAEVLQMEERFAPYGVAPHRESTDYRLMRAAWQDIVDRWLPAVVPFTRSEGGARRIILYLASASLVPALR